MKIKKIITCILFFTLFIILFQSCELFGLRLQQDYEYKSTPPNNVFNMTAYEFIEKRQGIDMRIYFEAINFCQLKEEFEKEDRTYVIFKDNVFASFLESYKYYEVKNADKTFLTNVLGQYVGLKSYGVLDMPYYALKVESLYPKAPLYIGLLPTSQTQINAYQVVLNSYPASKRITWVNTTNIKVTNGYIYVVDNMPLIVL